MHKVSMGMDALTLKFTKGESKDLLCALRGGVVLGDVKQTVEVLCTHLEGFVGPTPAARWNAMSRDLRFQWLGEKLLKSDLGPEDPAASWEGIVSVCSRKTYEQLTPLQRAIVEHYMEGEA